MLHFAVFDDNGPATEWPLRHAYAFGPDDVPVQADILFENGCIRCVKSTDAAAGIALQFDLDHMVQTESGLDKLGCMTLHTCLLPDRDQPYLLSLELARRRIMTFLNKLEDWGLFDLSPDDPVMQMFERARQAFTDALVAHRNGDGGFSPEADKLARRALAIAVDAGERLAVLDAHHDLPPRVRGEIYRSAAEHYQRVHSEPPPPDAPVIVPSITGVVLPTRPMVGCAVNPAIMNESLQKIIVDSCDFISLPMRWSAMEPSEERYSFADTDRWIEWAYRTAKIPILGGPVIEFRPTCVPEWLYIWENDYETLRELVYEHVKSVVTRYRRTIRRWTIASGLHVNNNFKLSFEQMMDLTRVAVLVVRKLHPQAKVQLELTQPWGEYYSSNRRALPPLLYADMLIQSGVKVDVIGIRLQMGQHQPGQSVRDLMSISSMLDRFAQFERPIAVTALGAPSSPQPDRDDAPNPGHWRQPWSPEVQAEWLQQVVSICLSKPYMHSVCWQELADSPNSDEMPNGGLLDASGAPKPALAALSRIRHAIRGGQAPSVSARAGV